jgi:hypothetical protein
MDNNQSNENQWQQNNFQNFQFGQQVVPNSTATLVLGILSIVSCWLYGLPGVILGIIALYISSAGKKAYESNPSWYSLASYNNLKAGRICAIVGLCLSAIYFVMAFIIVVFLGTAIGAFSLIN